MSAGRLEGLGVVVTRPRPAADRLAEALVREGARAFIFPALVIEPTNPSPRGAEALGRLAECGLAIFISANAVEHGLAIARRRRARCRRRRGDRAGAPELRIPRRDLTSRAPR
jgi:uroporphyrinogen-III synthase